MWSLVPLSELEGSVRPIRRLVEFPEELGEREASRDVPGDRVQEPDQNQDEDPRAHGWNTIGGKGTLCIQMQTGVDFGNWYELVAQYRSSNY